MELTCELSALTYAEMYRLIAADRPMRERLDYRLSILNRDASWLDEAEQTYRAFWEWEVEQAHGDVATTGVVSGRHAELATWLIAPLRSLGPSADFSADLARTVSDSVRQQFPDAGRVPEHFRIGIVAWTVGRVCGELDRTYPLLPAELPPDEDVSAAYAGLLEHVAALRYSADPWPEMLGSAILWRVAGIAEGLRPQPAQASLPASLGLLMKEARPVLPEALHSKLSREWDEFRLVRNSFTHVTPVHGGYGFAAVEDRMRCADDVTTYLAGATYFVCNEVAVRLAETDDPMGRAQMLDVLEEISWVL